MKTWTTMYSVVLLTSLMAAPIAQAESLTEAVAKVLEANPQIRAKVYERLATDQQLRQARAGYLPSLDLTAGTGYTKHRRPDTETLHPREAALTLTQNIFNGFGTVNDIDLREQQVLASAYTLQGTSENLALETCRAYLEVLRRDALKDVAQKSLETHLEIMEKIKQRSDSGVGNRADTEQVMARVALAKSNLIVAETNLLDSYSSYQAVVGHRPEGLTKPTRLDDKIPESLEAATKRALANNPALKSAMADLSARKETYELVKAAFYPNIDVIVEQRWDEEISRVDEERDELTAMLKLRYNLFSGFKDQSRRKQNLELISQSRENKNNIERQIVESMNLSWMAYQSNKNRMDLLRQRIESSRMTARAYAQQFEIGRRTLLDVLNAEAEAINSESDLIDAEHDVLQAQYRVFNTMGELVQSFGLERPAESQVDEVAEAE